jgi:hypothetical protein
MIKTFTENDLIRFIYHETTESEEREINKALSSDAVLQLQYNELITVKNQMDESQLEPSQSVINSILTYARRLQEKH